MSGITTLQNRSVNEHSTFLFVLWTADVHSHSVLAYLGNKPTWSVENIYLIQGGFQLRMVICRHLRKLTLVLETEGQTNNFVLGYMYLS